MINDWVVITGMAIGGGIGAAIGTVIAYRWLVRRERIALRRLRNDLNTTADSVTAALADVGKARREYLESEGVKRNDAV